MGRAVADEEVSAATVYPSDNFIEHTAFQAPLRPRGIKAERIPYAGSRGRPEKGSTINGKGARSPVALIWELQKNTRAFARIDVEEKIDLGPQANSECSKQFLVSFRTVQRP